MERQTDAKGRRPTLWDGRPTLWGGIPALRDAMGRHGVLWDGRPTLWDGRPTLCEGRPALRNASVGLPPSNVLVSRLYTVCMPCMWDCNDKSGR